MRISKRPLASIVAASALVLSALTLSPQAAEALGKVKCDVNNQPAVAIGNYDPIVNHNQPSSMHEHQFFGNIAFHSLANPNTANYDDLVGKTNNCRKVLGLNYSADSAGYWIPTARYTAGPLKGRLIESQQLTAYYRPFTNTGKFGVGRAFPPDTRLIGTKYNWSCGQFSVQYKRDGAVQSIPDCTGESGKPGHTLTAHIDFPSCWDGVLPNHRPEDVGNTSDNAHYAYPVRGACPAGFPNKMVGLRETVQFKYVGNGTDIGLSSDEHAGKTDGMSLHADFWNTWMQPEFERFVKECVSGTVPYSVAKCDP
jgi:hypothetical protein